MMHTTKLILVPATPAAISAESELKKVLDDSSLDQDSKLVKCQELINKYTKSTQINENKHQHIISSLPKKFQKTASLLLDFIDKNPYMKFNEVGEMIYEGQKVPGSHLVDLIHDISRSRVSKKPVIGAGLFIKALNKANVPHELIGNIERWKLLNKTENTVAYKKKWNVY